MSSPRTGEDWTRDETILAFDLLVRSGHSPRHEEVAALASRLGRSVGSVTRKLANLIAAETGGTSGLTHRSHFDNEIASEFRGRATALRASAGRIRSL